jgi:rhodanese-related sulfurtransferase
MSEILEVPSKDIKEYINNNSNAVLIDVRTEQEWDHVGKPNAEELGVTSHFLSYQIGEKRILNEDFEQQFLDLNIDKSKTVLFICRSGVRSLHAAEIIDRLGYTAVNISGGFEGSATINDAGWKMNGLPCK